MTLIEDDAEINPEIPPSQLSYVHHLKDKHKQYTRFFDALLVPRPSHAAFFRDLKGFRGLPTTIQALTLCNPEDVSITKEQRQENYRNVTRSYIGSRFAHPWCRKAMAGMGSTKIGGWAGAEWTATGRRLSKEQQEQEEKLHKLLVPIWITFRGRMFPGEEVVEQWWEEHQLELVAKSNAATSGDLGNSGVTPTNQNMTEPHVELGFAMGGSSSKNEVKHSVVSEDDEESRRQAGVAATGLLRLAAAGMIINSMPKMQKWKLKRELKKQAR